MVRLLGATLVAAGCGWMGFRAAAALKSQVRALEDMADGLSLLAQEMELDEPPLPELMERLARRCRGPAKLLFRDCRQALDRLEEEDFSRAWRKLAAERQELGEEGRQALLPVGDILGRCGCEAPRRGAATAADSRATASICPPVRRMASISPGKMPRSTTLAIRAGMSSVPTTWPSRRSRASAAIPRCRL